METTTMKICLECGTVFKDEETKRWTEAHGEKVCGCPNCLGGFTDVCRCGYCGDYFPDGTLFDGICRSCLAHSVNYETGLQFLLDTVDYFDIFMFETWLDTPLPSRVGRRMHDYLICQYNRERAEANLGEHAFLDAIREFILDYDGDIGKEVYAKWLRRRENA